jgi:metacaspase-1
MMATHQSTAKARALVVGVASYEHISPPLPSIVSKDARDVAALLTDPHACGYDPTNVKLLVDAEAKKSAVVAALREVAQASSEEDPFVLYFSGHGDRQGPVQNETSFLLTYDAKLSSPMESAISGSELFELLAAVRSQRQVILLDACHAGGVGVLKSSAVDEGPSGIGKGFVDGLLSGKGRVVIASSRPDQKSFILQGAANSLFTDSLLKALHGGARDRGDGTIGVLDVFDFISKDVPARARQNPVLKADALEGNFPIVRVSSDTEKASSVDPAASPVDVLAALYPQGPTEADLWRRAGGDVSRLDLEGSGLTRWHRAVRLLENGGGGTTMKALLSIARADFPQNRELGGLAGRV